MTTLFCSRKNLRPYMEDTHVIFENDKYKLFAVYDGHGGDKTSEHLANVLHHRLIEVMSEKKCIERVFLELDEKMYYNPMFQCGSTAVIVVHSLDDNVMHFINLGDSRATLIHNGEVVHSTVDHKPENEVERIKKAGGYVSQQLISLQKGIKTVYRVNGVLAVARAFGDSFLKGQYQYKGINSPVSPVPDVTTYDLEHNKEYILVVASDGLWDTVSNDEAAECVTHFWTQNIANNLADDAIDGGSGDNITVLVHKFTAEATKELPRLIENQELPRLIKKIFSNGTTHWYRLDENNKKHSIAVRNLPEKYVLIEN